MSKLIQSAALFTLLVPVAGSRISARQPAGEPSPEYFRLFDKLSKHLARQEWASARPLAQQCVELALGHEWGRAGNRAVATLAAIDASTFRYRQALSHYLEARRLAETVGDWDMVVLHSYNLSNLYFHLGALNEAHDSLRRAESLLPLGGKVLSPTNLKLHRARIHARLHSARDAMPLFQEAAMAADQGRSAVTREQEWDLAAVAHMRDGNMDQAFELAVESFRMRKLTSDRQLSSSYLLLSRLEFERGNSEQARVMAERAMESAQRAPPRFPVYSFYLARGLSRQRVGDLNGARLDLEEAAWSVRSLRLGLSGSDVIRTAAGVEHAGVFAALADVYIDLFERTRQTEYVRAGFTAAAEGRAYSLREASGESQEIRNRLPLDYYSVLDSYRQAEAQFLSSASPTARQRMDSLRVQLAEREIQAGQEQPSANSRPELAASSEGVALIQFLMGPRRSLRWTSAGNQMQVTVLPAAAEIEAAARAFVAEIRSGGKDEEAARLGAMLFGDLPRHAAVAPVWRVVPDGELFQAPLSALKLPSGRYLAEEHAIRILAYPSSEASTAARDGRESLVAFADPISNPGDSRYDARWASRSPLQSGLGRGWLPRVPGTAREAMACARIWPSGSARVFSGKEATIQNLAVAVATNPGVLHLATHLVPAPGDPRQSRIVLSLGADGKPQLVNPETIATYPVTSRLIVMSGCRAGAAAPVAGEGVIGIARAWLFAGAESVVAGLWPVPDDSGDLIQSFYRHWRSDSMPDEERALQLAQLEMIRSASWRSRPGYWASYFVFGKS